MPDPTLRIDLLDVPRLHPAVGEPMRLERKLAAMLAVLALDGARPRADLAALLWPDAPPALARNSLRQRLFRVHRSAGRTVIVGHDELRLADDVTHDLADARERLVADPQARLGELLGGFDYSDTAALADWADRARTQWRRRRASLLVELASGHEERHELALALQYAERLLVDEPLQEHAHRRLMRLHYLRGDRSAALAAYERCRDLLDTELGTPPDRETERLAEQIGTGQLPATRPALLPVAVLRPPRLVGREEDRAAVAAALDARGVLLVRGEAGIGKSRLLEDAVDGRTDLLAAGARAGESRLAYALAARVATAAQARSETALPAWVRAELARLVPALGAPPAARLDPLRLQQALAGALEVWAAQGLAGIVIDDLHHADEASLECLLGLADATQEPRLAWIFGVRDAEMPEAVRRWLDAGRARITDLPVAPLDTSAVAALLDELALPSFDADAWAAPLARHSGGNPLFALETVRALLALGPHAAAPARLPVPAGLGALIARRLAGLPEQALKLVRIAALAGSDFDADVAGQVLGLHPLDLVEPWRELEQAQILADGRFTHDLIAETAAAELPAGIARALHARLAETLAGLGRAAARVAPHWARAEAWPRAGEAFAAAATEAQRASRRADEIALWHSAAEGFDRAGMAGRAFDARADSIESLLVVAGLKDAQALADRLLADAKTEPQRMRALTARATVCLYAGDHAGGETAARAALDAATALGALWPRFEAARLLAVALSQAVRADEALAVIEPFRDIVEAEGSFAQRHHFWCDYAYVLKAVQRLRDSAEALRKAIASAESVGDHAEVSLLTSNLAVIVGNFGRPQESVDHGKRARALLEPLGQAGGPAAGAVDLYIGSANGMLGRYAEALADLDRAAACFERNGAPVWIALAANYRATFLIQLGQYARAGQALDHALATTPAIEARRSLLLSRLARAQGRSHPAALTRAVETIGPQGDHMMRMLVRLEATHAMDADEAASACDALQAEAEAVEHAAVAMRARVLAVAHRLRAGTFDAARRGDVDGIARLLDAVQPADTYLPEAWWTVSAAYDALGDGVRADDALRRGREWIVERALPEVPEPYRSSFLDRNDTNLRLLAAAARRLALPAARAGARPIGAS